MRVVAWIPKQWKSDWSKSIVVGNLPAMNGSCDSENILAVFAHAAI